MFLKLHLEQLQLLRCSSILNITDVFGIILLYAWGNFIKWYREGWMPPWDQSSAGEHGSQCHIPFLPGLRNVQSLTLVQSKLSQALSSSFTLANLSWHLTQARQGITLPWKQSTPPHSSPQISTTPFYFCLPYISLYLLLPYLSIPHYFSVACSFSHVSICLCQTIFCSVSIVLNLSSPCLLFSSLPR